MTTQGLGERVDSYRGTSVATLEKIFEKLFKNLLTSRKFSGIIYM